jgi:hypothetical protein
MDPLWTRLLCSLPMKTKPMIVERWSDSKIVKTYVDSFSHFYDEKTLECYSTPRKWDGLPFRESCHTFLSHNKKRRLRRINRIYGTRLCVHDLTHVLPTWNAIETIVLVLENHSCHDMLSVGCGNGFWERMIWDAIETNFNVIGIDLIKSAQRLIDVKTHVRVRNLRYHPELTSCDVLFLGWPTRNGYDYGAWKAFRGKLVIFIGVEEDRRWKDVGSDDFWQVSIPSMNLITKIKLPFVPGSGYCPYVYIFEHNIEAARNL